jgi:hypothetical protein
VQSSSVSATVPAVLQCCYCSRICSSACCRSQNPSSYCLSSFRPPNDTAQASVAMLAEANQVYALAVSATGPVQFRDLSDCWTCICASPSSPGFKFITDTATQHSYCSCCSQLHQRQFHTSINPYCSYYHKTVPVTAARIVQFLVLSQNSSVITALTPVAVPAISTKDKASIISTAGTALYPADFKCCYLFVTTVEAPAILRSNTAPASVRVLDQFKYRSIVVAYYC